MKTFPSAGWILLPAHGRSTSSSSLQVPQPHRPSCLHWGVGIVYSRKNSPQVLCKRGFRLFAGGYLLNAARSGILTAIGTACTGRFDPELIKYLFLNGDIFQFAGLALMLSALFICLKTRPLVIAGISLLMQLVGRCLANLPEVTGDFGYIEGLVYKCTWVCCFPLLQWYVYPALGILYGTVLRHVSDTGVWYRRIGTCAAVLLIFYAAILAACNISMAPFYSLAEEAFYNQSFLTTVFSILLICLILSCKFRHGGAINPVNLDAVFRWNWYRTQAQPC